MKKIKDGIKRGAFLTAILFSCVFLLGWADSWEDIRRESAKVTSVNARFTQSKHMQILSKPLISQGRFYFQTPDSVRWEYTSPVKSILLMGPNGIKRFTLGSKGLVGDASGSLQSMQVVLQEISRWSQGQFAASEHFSATLKGGKDPQIVLLPREKGLSKMISRIVISPSPERPGLLKSIKIFENEGNYTLFEFSEVQINGPISESLFRDAE